MKRTLRHLGRALACPSFEALESRVLLSAVLVPNVIVLHQTGLPAGQVSISGASAKPAITRVAQAPINLRSAAAFAVMATTAINGTGNQIYGDVGVNPGSSQGIPPGEVNGSIHVDDLTIVAAQADLLAAYNDAVSRSVGSVSLPGNLGGLTFTPGLYTNSSSVLISGSGPGNNVTLDAQGNPNAIFIFQMASTLTTGPGAQVILAGGAKASNIFWQVGSSATLDTTTIFYGNILASVSITVNNGSMVVGRLLGGSSTGGAVTVNASTVTVPFVSAVSPTHLVFKQQPTTTVAGQTIAPVTVLIEDSRGRVVTSVNSNVTLTIASGPAGGALAGTVALQAVNGVATFSDLSSTVAGSYTFTASDGILTSTKSRKFTVAPAAATQLLFVQGPSASVIAGSKITPAMTVVLQDQFGNVETNLHSKVILSILSGPNGGTLSGNVNASTSKGIAKFSNVALRTTGTYTLQATDGLLNAMTSSFNVTPAAAKKLVFVQQPTASAAGVAIAPAIVLDVEDRFGNVVTTDSSLVMLAIRSGPHAAILGGTLSVAAAGGVATFGDLSLNLVGTYRFRALDGRLTPVTSNSFLVS